MSKYPTALAACLFLCLTAHPVQAQVISNQIVSLPQNSAVLDQGVVYAGTGTSNLGLFGITIDPGPALAGNPVALAAFNRAASQWMSRISDPITITIDANFVNLGDPTFIGQTNSVLLSAGYNTLRNAMVNDALKDGPDDAIVSSLPTAAQFSAILPPGIGLDGTITTTKANFKALGFTGLDASFGAADGEIDFNTLFGFDFDNRDGVTPGLVDFETVAAHEIGHVLGFNSAVDDVDFLLANKLTDNISLQPLDLFRFQNNVAGRDPATAADFSTFPRLLSPGFDAITDDTTNEYRMSTGVFAGDGQEASHWKDDALTGTLVGIMDPTLAPGTVHTVADSDLRALDLIGYDISPRQAQTVPEPGSFVLLGICLLPLLACRRRRTA